jgi:hypothetical protein
MKCKGKPNTFVQKEMQVAILHSTAADNRFEIAEMYQNSGISVVVPAQFVKSVLDQALGKPSTSQAKNHVVIRNIEVLNAPPDVGPKIASSLSVAELKRQTASFLVTFQDSLRQEEEQEQRLFESLHPTGISTTRDEDAVALTRLGKELNELRDLVRQEYLVRFKAEAKRLRDDLWARLPIAARDPRSVRLYDYGLDLVELHHVADDLERLSKLLPD